MTKVFIDSGGWIACINKKDKHHQKAIEYLRSLRKNKVVLITSNYIKAETVTWLKYNVNHKTALSVMKLWEEAKKISEEANKIFKKYDDHILSYTDCTSFAICRELEINKIFGFDSDFNILGYLLAPEQVKEKNYHYEILRPSY